MRSKIFNAEIRHQRYLPAAHGFAYRLIVYALDLDELPELDRKLPLFGYDRPQVTAIFHRDYLMRGAGTLREKLVRCLESESVDTAPGRVILVTAPRFLNTVFNPVSFYFCYTEDDRLLCVVAEVNNTYGERHIYVLDRPLDGGGDGGEIRYRAEKAFHVSPYNRVEGTYEFRFADIRRGLDIGITLSRNGTRFFEAQLTGRPAALTAKNHTKMVFRHPLIPHLSMPRIYWEAFRLHFFRKLPFFDKPVPASPKTIGREKPGMAQSAAKKAVTAYFGRIARGQLRMRHPDGGVTVFGGRADGPVGELIVRDYRFYTRTLAGGEIGFGESYVAREWDSPDLPALLAVIVLNRDPLAEGHWITSLLADAMARFHHTSRSNAIGRSRENIQRHYDIGNDFFRVYLDATMTYSAAVFGAEDESLEAAQARKYRKIIEKAEITAADHVLEIGCGWGGFAVEAAKSTGCRVTAVTLSEAQCRYARQRIERHGLADRVDVRLGDYRDITGRFDRIVSIEMLEAVGHRYLGRFFSRCDRLLAENGVVVIQTIVNADRRYLKERKKSDWLKKHIFPGGQVPSLTAICEAMTRSSRLVVDSVENIGDHYALTLKRWRQAFLRNRKALAEMRYDPQLGRKWDYYLGLCQAAFATRALRDLQLVLVRECSERPARPFRAITDD